MREARDEVVTVCWNCFIEIFSIFVDSGFHISGFVGHEETQESMVAPNILGISTACWC